jgi:dynein assembly factor 3
MGYWGDILNGPYHAFGVSCEEKAFFLSSNKQYTRTAVDVAEYNVQVCE